MKAGAMLRETVVACAVLGAAVAVTGAAAGHLMAGAGIGLGLLLGSANGYLMVALLDRRAPFVAASMLRLVTFSTLALTAAFLLGSQAWSVLIGVAGAQLVMVAAGVRQGLRT